MGVLSYFHTSVGWKEILKRTARESIADDILSLAAQLAYYFFLALFPALLFLVAVASFFPLEHLMDTIIGSLSRIAPPAVLSIVEDQIRQIARSGNGGLLTIGMVLTIWSSSAGIVAIANALNTAYDVTEGRPWWKVRLVSIGLTVALTVFVPVSFGLVVLGPALAQRVATWLHLGQAFVITWTILQWPIVFLLIAFAVALIYYFAPDVEQEFAFLTPGSVTATLLWVIFSLGFKVYVSRFADYNATYGALGGVIVLLLWFYASGLALLIGAELNAEIEHASVFGKDEGQKVARETHSEGHAAAEAFGSTGRVLAQEPLSATSTPHPASGRRRHTPLRVLAGGLLAALFSLARERRIRD
jgi:membrane protein